MKMNTLANNNNCKNSRLSYKTFLLLVHGSTSLEQVIVKYKLKTDRLSKGSCHGTQKATVSETKPVALSHQFSLLIGVIGVGSER